jgi:hypothetical protein
MRHSQDSFERTRAERISYLAVLGALVLAGATLMLYVFFR